jgi:hypothetical protein
MSYVLVFLLGLALGLWLGLHPEVIVKLAEKFKR